MKRNLNIFVEEDNYLRNPSKMDDKFILLELNFEHQNLIMKTNSPK